MAIKARAAGIAVFSIFVVTSCSADQRAGTEQGHSDNSEISTLARPATRHVGRWTEADLNQMIAAAQKRGGSLSPSEIADLRTAAKDGVLTAYYVLYHHESMDGDLNASEELLRECAHVGEPNCLVIVASRLHMKGLKEPAKTQRVKYLTDAKRMLEASLKRSSTLMVARPSTVRDHISEVDEALGNERI